jgi:hypothetical protein
MGVGTVDLLTSLKLDDTLAEIGSANAAISLKFGRDVFRDSSGLISESVEAFRFSEVLASSVIFVELKWSHKFVAAQVRIEMLEILAKLRC